MKVLHIGEYVKGGVATYLHTLFSGKMTDDIDNYLVLSQSISEKSWELPSAKIYYYPYKRSLTNIPLAMINIYKVITKVKPDILMIHSTWAGVLARFPFLFMFKRHSKIIYNSHGWAFLRQTSSLNKKIYALIERILSSVTDCIINVSHYEHSAALAYGLPKDKLRCIYNGLDDVEDSKAVAIENLNPNKINLLFIGRLDRQKGLDWLLEQFQDRLLRHDIHLYVIGESVVDNKAIAISDKRVTFLGWVDHTLIDGYCRLCDALIMPSRWEAFGLTAVEAMRNERAVIASNRGALPELVRPLKSGWLFDLDDGGSSLQEILASLDKKSLADMGKRARAIYETELTADKMRQEICAIYKEVNNK